jgi:hypothetical protein
MLKIIHRVNALKELKKIPAHYGVEIDVRGYGNKLVLNHEPLVGGENLEKYLAYYKHAFIIFNIKEAGIEQRVIDLAKKFKIKNYFLLDVESPYLYKASRAGFRNIAVRYSEFEPIENMLKYRGLVDWAWIDTATTLPLDKKTIQKLAGFKTCLVSPEPWGRPYDIVPYRDRMKALSFEPDAVMVDWDYAHLW